MQTDAPPTPPSPLPPAEPLRELALIFLRFGTIAFGGPAAHIALMQQEFVIRRAWLTSTEFLDMLAATNFIPGPNSTELAIHIGYRRAGIRGLLVAGSCFIIPAALICTAIGYFYVRFGGLPISTSILDAVKPVVIAVVAQALLRLGKSTIKTPLLAAVTAVAIAALLLRLNELIVLFGAGVLVALIATARRPKNLTLPMIALPAAAPLLPLFLVFLKIGSVLFGSGYVLLAFLKSDLVERYHWLSEPQLLDAIAVGQITPGPVFTTATFIGYLVGRLPGAFLATLGIFLPAFFFVAVSAPFLPRLRRSPTAAAFLDGLNVASLALMAVVTFDLSHTAFASPLAVALGIVSLILLLWKNVNSAWLVLAAALIGIARALLPPLA